MVVARHSASLNLGEYNMARWEVFTESGRAGLYVEAATAEEALRKGSLKSYYPLHGSVTGVRESDQTTLDTSGD